MDEQRLWEPAAWPFVGRDEELAFVARAIGEGQRGVVLAGGAGVGKTSLAHECARAAAPAWTTEWVRATRAAHELSFGAFAHLISALARGGSPETLMRAALDELAARTEKEQLLLVVDDAQWLDAESSVLLHLAVTQDLPLFVCIVLRREVVPPDTIVELWKGGHLARVEIQPLGERDVSILAEAALDDRVDRATERFLWSTTRGNALYLRELLREGIRTGRLRRRGGIWRWDGDVVVGSHLRSLIEDRVLRLPESLRDALEVVALVEPVEHALMLELQLADALDELEREGIATVRVDHRRRVVMLGHPLYGDVVRDRVPVARAASIRADVARKLLSGPARRSGDVLRAATLLAETDVETDVEVLVDGAQQAWGRAQPRVAARLARAALRAQPGHTRASYLLGEALADEGEFDEARALWSALEAGELDDETRANVVSSHAVMLATSLDEFDEADEIIAQALAIVVDPTARAVLLSGRALYREQDRRSSEVRNELQMMLADDATPPIARTRAWIGLFAFSLQRGELHEVLPHAGRALDDAVPAATEFPLGRHWIEVNLFFATVLSGDLDAAEHMANARLEATLNDVAVLERAHWTQALGIVALQRGDAATAVRHLEEAVALFTDFDSMNAAIVLTALAIAYAALGNVEGAERALENSRAFGTSIAGVSLYDEARAAGAVLAARGDRTHAIETLLEAAEQDLDRGNHVSAILKYYDAFRIGQRAIAPTLSSMTETMGGILPLLGAHARAAASRDAFVLSATAREFATRGFWLHAGEVASDAATIARATGDASLARGMEIVVADAAQRCGAAAAHLAIADGNRLTPRELEIALLAARGRSDREIARDLGVSIRTVQAHLRAVFQKVQVTSRRDLSSALGLVP